MFNSVPCCLKAFTSQKYQRERLSHTAKRISHSPYEEYLATDAYKRPPNPTIKATNELILSELHRSREPYIAKFRKGCTDVNQLWTDDVPVWAAVETLSLGTLSKAISFRNDGNAVYQGTCKALGVGQPYLSPQLRSFTFIRNKLLRPAIW